MKAYVVLGYEDASGRREPMEQVDFPRTNDEEKRQFNDMLRYGYIATSKERAQAMIDGQEGPQDPIEE